MTSDVICHVQCDMPGCDHRDARTCSPDWAEYVARHQADPATMITCPTHSSRLAPLGEAFTRQWTACSIARKGDRGEHRWHGLTMASRHVLELLRLT